MPTAILSDIHANIDALEAVVKAAHDRKADQFICLGDTVGYGPEPEECIDLVRELCVFTVLGNHDEAVLRPEMQAYLPADGKAAAEIHARQLSPDRREWLSSLPLSITDQHATYVHATPLKPEAWLRLEGYAMMKDQFDHFQTDLCFVGHSHRPGIASNKLGVLSVRPGHRYVVDVGSVGQPRDGDPRACFALFDSDATTCEIVRVPYNVERCVGRLAERGYPPRLGERLRNGR